MSSERRAEIASNVGAGVWDRAWGLTGGLVELGAIRDAESGQIDWGLMAFNANPVTAMLNVGLVLEDPRYTNKFYDHIKGSYKGYREAGFDPAQAGIYTALSNTPVLAASVHAAEMVAEHSLQGGDFGRALTTEDYFLKPLDIGINLLPLSLLRGPKASKQPVGNPAVAPVQTPALPVRSPRVTYPVEVRTVPSAPTKTGWVAQNFPRVNQLASNVVHGGIGRYGPPKLYAGAKNLAQRLGFEVCFAAGTPLRTPSGSRPIEAFAVGDPLLSRDENNPEGLVVVKFVEAVFVREGLILELDVAGQTIRTTAEHPFFAWAKGWVAANLLTAEDTLLTEDGRWVSVEAVRETGEWERVIFPTKSGHEVNGGSGCTSVHTRLGRRTPATSATGRGCRTLPGTRTTPLVPGREWRTPPPVRVRT